MKLKKSSPLVVITSYFNPCRYETRRRHYDTFMNGMARAGVTCITVECAFGDAPFELEESPTVLQVRADTLLWQKERLLNLAASWLPDYCEYVGWFDCDILFMNKNWANDLISVLKTHKVAQAFETCLRLQKDGTAGPNPDIPTSFAAVMAKEPESLNAGRYDRHGHTGYAWAMRREIFDEVGLYEAAVSGSADHFMAHAIYNDYNFCICNALKHDHNQIEHLKTWGHRFHKLVQGSLGEVPGEIQHLWHGDAVNRRYFLRMHDITNLGFNPWTDLHVEPGRPMAWTPNMGKNGLKDYFANYFESRQEDGQEAVPA